MSITATNSEQHRVRNALIAGGAVATTVSLSPIMLNTMFASPVYGEPFAKTVLRNSAPYVAALALPAGLGAGTSQLVGGGGLGIVAGAAAGGVLGGALGATLLHRAIADGTQVGRLGTAGLVAGAGLLTGGLAAAVANSIAAGE